MIFVHVQKMYKHVQKMYNILILLIGVPDYSSICFVFFQKMKRKLTPWREKIFRDNKSKY